MKKASEILESIVFRYALIILSSLNGLAFFYLFFTPLTLSLLNLLLRLFSIGSLNGSFIITHSDTFQIISACIAGSAYFLLFFLNLSTPGINPKKRFVSIVFSFLVFLI